MKNIKSYKLFESNIDNLTIVDILQEITDIGYKIELKTLYNSENLEGNIIDIVIWNRPNYTFVDEIIDTLQRLIDYLKDKGYVLTRDSLLYYNNLTINIPDESRKREDYVVKRWGTTSIEWEWIEDSGKFGIWDDIEIKFYYR
jgi:hypothetical protein